MKKYLKKGLFVLLFMMISIIWQAEEGKAEDFVSGDFKYVVNEDTEEQTITITGYTGDDSNVVIPEEIDGKKKENGFEAVIEPHKAEWRLRISGA